VSPSNTAFGLTKSGPGAEPGEPDKYYPTGNRHYGRVVPADHIQAAALAQYMADEDVKKVYILDDNEVYGQGLARNAQTAAKELGLEIVGTDSWEGKASNYRALAAKIKESGADAVLTAGIIDNNGPQLYKDLNAAMPDAKLFGPDGMATTEMAKEIPAKVGERSFLTVAAVAPDELPEAGKKFYADYQKEYGEAENEIDPYAIFGYEAAGAVLEAMESAEDCADRQAVIDGFFGIENRESALGTYSIDENGDTTLSDYGGYRVEGGKLVFDRAIKAEAV
jgi:branched-chain amino acid transport system substrate-binding protein